ncbi:MAG: 3-dehydroquinate synthase, partial [bacterium]|nr:3-dehydroquinate synthase [bacterium]
MKTIQVPLKEKSYFVFVNGATPFQIPSSVRKILAAASRLVILTDSRLAGSHLKEVRAVLKKINPLTDAIIIPSGEKEKNLKRVEQVYQRLLALKVDRSSVLLNLGGGVIGDLGGFVAATMLRGIRFVQIPTSLVGQVDAAIGGKTGVNHPMGKNLIGAFHQPLFVLNHIPFLKTLP